MHIPFSLFLALKFLKPNRTFLSVVTIFSVLGVLLGVMLLVIVISVMSGFDNMWREKILSFNAHVTVTAYGEIADPEEILTRIRSVEGVTGAAPLIQDLVFIVHRGHVYTPILLGIDPELEKEVSQVPQHMSSGTYSVEENEVLVGSDLAAEMGLIVGEQILVYSSQSFQSLDEYRLPEELVVSGIYEMGMSEFDKRFMITSLDMARDLKDMEDGVNAIQVMTKEPLRAYEVAAELENALGRSYDVKTWMDLHRVLFDALKVEKNMMFFLFIFIVIVASFGITNTLITTTYLKTKEIGLLKSLGFSSGSIMGVFVWQGVIESFMGTIGGILSGCIILRYRNDLLEFLSNRFHFDLLPKEIYQLSQIPASTSMSDVSMIAGLTLMICACATFFPAFRAARLDPVKALRYE
ncbi:MAG: FtsX-like permease family protein [Kiritimatiellae bacterium]|nr:FtsX-like permease family protein [Kiritimatiellia bacterium]